jgi:hypothetical protein
MKNASLPAFVLSLVSTAAMALPPKSGVIMKSVADTLTAPAGGIGWPGTSGTATATWYRYLGLPVIAQSTPNDRLFAFPGRVNLVAASITAANDEGVFSNGPGYSATGSPAGTVPALIEGNPLPTPPNILGNLTGQLAAGSTLTNPSVERLQVSSNGIVACQTFSNDTVNVFREGIAANSFMLSLGAASAALPMTARQPGVMDDDCQNIAAREQWTGLIPQRVNRFQFLGGTGGSMNPLTVSGTAWFVASTGITPLGGLWWPTQGAVARLGSPSISAYGVVAAHCIDNVGPAYQRTQIRIEDPTGGQTIVMRQGDLHGPNPTGGNYFGVVNSSLMALNNRAANGNNKDLVAWQMTNMRTAPASGIINLPSLWCRQAPYPATPCTYITHGGGAVPAPGIPAHFFNTFYALHVAEGPATSPISRVIFGVNLVPASTPLKRAIYSCVVSGGVLVGPLTLIATNVPGITPLQPYSGGTDELATFGTPVGTSGHFFSVSRYGEVLFKATVGANIIPPGTTPATRQVLVVASPPTYGLEVWAQSGITTFTSMAGAPAIFTNFTLTQPDQGTYSRGQGIATLPDPFGTLLPNIIFRGHAGAAHAIILAN